MTFNHPTSGAVPDESSIFSGFRSPPIHRTALYRAKAAYSGMIVRCGNANGKNPSYRYVELRMTLSEWLEWALPHYEEFSRLHPNESPNAARFEDAGHYELGNVRIISFRENRAERRHQCRAVNGSKLCSRCFEIKSVDNFSLRSVTTDGLDYWCRDCKKENHRIRSSAARTVDS